MINLNDIEQRIQKLEYSLMTKQNDPNKDWCLIYDTTAIEKQDLPVQLGMRRVNIAFRYQGIADVSVKEVISDQVKSHHLNVDYHNNSNLSIFLIRGLYRINVSAHPKQAISKGIRIDNNIEDQYWTVARTLFSIVYE